MRLTRRDASAGASASGGGELLRRRLRPEEVASGRVEVRVRKGRVEIGASRDGVARMRWQIRRGEPKVRATAGALRISGRRMRLILELPDALSVRVRLREGDVTSWGAGNDLDIRARPGRFICRELRSTSVSARAEHISLHFADAPGVVDADGESVVVTVPPGPYRVDASPGAEVTVEVAELGGAAAVGSLAARGADVRVLAAVEPLPLAERDRT